MKRTLKSFLKKLKERPEEHYMIKMVKWLYLNLEEYFKKIGNPETVVDLRTVCHGDFTQGNVMVEDFKEGSDNKQRTAFIDWQSYFIGNGFIDISFIILYGTDITVFKQNSSLWDEALIFTMSVFESMADVAFYLSSKKSHKEKKRCFKCTRSQFSFRSCAISQAFKLSSCTSKRAMT
jgi:thiamine kinase-like enzyme